MRLIHVRGCPGNFRESLTTPTATFPEILMGLGDTPFPFPLDAFGVSISAPSAPQVSPPTQIPGYAYDSMQAGGDNAEQLL